MVSIRCKMVVKSALENLNLPYSHVDLGEATLLRTPTSTELEQLQITLKKAGLEIMEDRKAMLIEKIKLVIIDMVHYADELPNIKNSVYISQKLQHNYTYLANLFADVTGTTIEHFIIAHKIEKVKELLLYNETTLTEIAEQLHYSSVSHLSNQFKKVTGLTPTYFKSMKIKRDKPLEDL
ncbi:helix-turn-helix domain-containing protein [Phnomibacter sp. MR]|uniref:helix-turn-helix domain-containing protein n=1 Tax=Phnomibacter sp. MR TaxID=3042318 RepID=UPI003A81351E